MTPASEAAIKQKAGTLLPTLLPTLLHDTCIRGAIKLEPTSPSGTALRCQYLYFCTSKASKLSSTASNGHAEGFFFEKKNLAQAHTYGQYNI